MCLSYMFKFTGEPVKSNMKMKAEIANLTISIKTEDEQITQVELRSPRSNSTKFDYLSGSV